MAKKLPALQADSIDNKSVLMVVDFGKMGNSRSVHTSKINVAADKTMLKVNKALIDSKEYDDIKTHDGRSRTWLYTRALPSFFKEGVYRIPNPLLVEVDEYMDSRAKERTTLVAAFKKAYPQCVKDSCERLGVLGEIDEYKTAQDAAAEFHLKWHYVSFSVPETLKELKKGLFERETKKTEAMFVEARQQLQKLLRANMADLVTHLVDKMTVKDGKRQTFHDSSIGKFQDFLETFEARNIVNDIAMTEVVGKAKALLEGVDPAELRDDDALRERMRKGFAKIQATVAGMVIDAPTRKYRDED